MSRVTRAKTRTWDNLRTLIYRRIQHVIEGKNYSHSLYDRIIGLLLVSLYRVTDASLTMTNSRFFFFPGFIWLFGDSLNPGSVWTSRTPLCIYLALLLCCGDCSLGAGSHSVGRGLGVSPKAVLPPRSRRRIPQPEFSITNWKPQWYFCSCLLMSPRFL